MMNMRKLLKLSGTVLFAKNEDQPYYPASITKILTALIVLEHCSLDEEVTFSHDDVYNVEAGSDNKSNNKIKRYIKKKAECKL